MWPTKYPCHLAGQLSGYMQREGKERSLFLRKHVHKIDHPSYFSALILTPVTESLDLKLRLLFGFYCENSLRFFFFFVHSTTEPNSSWVKTKFVPSAAVYLQKEGTTVFPESSATVIFRRGANILPEKKRTDILIIKEKAGCLLMKNDNMQSR